VGPWPRARDRAQRLRDAGFEAGPPPAGAATPDAYTLLLPVGVVGLPTPLNVVPALAAGNAVVLVARNARELAVRLHAAELPSGVFNLVEGGELAPRSGIDLVRAAPGPAVTLQLDELGDDEAMRRAGAAERVSIWTQDLVRGHRLARALAAEHVWINAPAADVPDPPERYARRLTVHL
jgi:acyl-CoA reductase-like NAD-dependent aldehyde dehydrogenase